MSQGAARIVNDLATEFVYSRCLHAVTALGVADSLGEDEETVEDLAAKLNLDSSALRRVMRLLSTHDVFALGSRGYRHTEASRLLKSDHPSSLRSWVLLNGLPATWAAAGALEHCIRTGQPSAPLVLGTDFWTHLKANDEAGAIFNAAMTVKSGAQIPAIVKAIDWARFSVIADIGGGKGHLLAAILKATSSARGILFDLPQVLGADRDEIEDGGRMVRCPGSFLTDEIPSCDGMVLMEVLHNWPDERTAEILRACRRSIAPNGRLFIIEAIIRDANVKEWPKVMDILMLQMYGSRQRSAEEFRALLVASGWKPVAQTATESGIDIIQAEPGSAC